MAALSALDVMHVWEAGSVRDAVARALLILATAEPGASEEELARLPVGERDTRLFRVRGATFGPELRAWASCPRCSARIEFTIDARDVIARGAGRPVGPRWLEVGAYRIRFRLLDSRDLASVTGAASADAAAAALAVRSVEEATHEGEAVVAERLPAEVLGQLSQALGAADPDAETVFTLACPECGHDWEAPFDIGDFLWSEVAAEGRRLVTHVHLLARAYGWTESDVLSMSPARRQCYLDLVG